VEKKKILKRGELTKKRRTIQEGRHVAKVMSSELENKNEKVKMPAHIRIWRRREIEDGRNVGRTEPYKGTDKQIEEGPVKRDLPR